MPNYFLRAASGQYVPLKLAGELGAGAAGKVFSLGAPEHKQLAAKIYNKASDCDVRRLTAMIGSPPDSVRDNKSGLAQFAWPSEIIYDRETPRYRAIGFTMPKIDMQHSVSLEYYFDSTLADRLSPDDRSPSSKVAIAHNLAALTADLHNKGSCFIDFKPQNMRVTKRNRLVSFLDCDGYRVTAKDGVVFGATHFSTGYIAPEALQNNQGPCDLSYDQDRFALAVVLFQLLNFGIHPFQGIPSQNIDAQGDDDKVKARLYPYGIVPNRMMAPKKSSVHGLFPTRLRQLFDQAFLGRERPSARQWQEALLSLQGSDGTVRCQLHPSNPEHGGFIGKDCLVCFRSKIIQVSHQTRPVANYQPRPPDLRTTPPPQRVVPPSAPPPASSGLIRGVVFSVMVLGFIVRSCSSDTVKSPPEQVPASPVAQSAPAPRPPPQVAPTAPVPPRIPVPTPEPPTNTKPMPPEMVALIKEIESRHPELNPKDRRFNQQLVQEALDRQKAYMKGGVTLSPTKALYWAISNMESASKFATNNADTRPRKRSGDNAQPRPYSKYITDLPKPKSNSQDMRHCLKLPTDAEIMRCANQSK